jgi:hypothetical protein
MRECACGTPLPYSGRGRRPETCAACKRKQARARGRKYDATERGAEMRRNRERTRDPERVRAQIAQLKADLIRGYGGCCACCGEDDPLFLTVDHVDGGGGEERRRRPGGTYGLWRRLRREGFPPTCQLLCWNCNCARALNGGVCPHEDQIAAVLPTQAPEKRPQLRNARLSLA